jgi:uncharacterized membrane protein YhhN
VTGPIALMVVGLAALLIAERAAAPRLQAIAKTSASTGFLWLAWSAGALESTYGKLIGAGLVASWVGDVALLSKAPRWFLLGLVSFALAHVAYAGAFWTLGATPLTIAAVGAGLTLPALVVWRWLSPNLPDDMVRPVQVYILLISAMVACAAAATVAGAPRLVLSGAIAFYLSDLSVARDRFVREELSNRLWGLPLYYGAQLMLALSIAETG